MVARGDVVHASDAQLPFLLTPDSTRVLYVADQDVDETFELYLAPIDGSERAKKLNGRLVGGGDVATSDSRHSFLQFTPDGTEVVYAADERRDGTIELFVAPLDASRSSRRVSGLIEDGGDVAPGFQLARDGPRVVYAASRRAGGALELFEALLSGGPARRLDGPMVAGGSLLSTSTGALFEIEPDGKAVVYVADQDTDGIFELYESPLTGPSQPGAQKR